jgi:hypothetical protein
MVEVPFPFGYSSRLRGCSTKHRHPRYRSTATESCRWLPALVNISGKGLFLRGVCPGSAGDGTLPLTAKAGVLAYSQEAFSARYRCSRRAWGPGGALDAKARCWLWRFSWHDWGGGRSCEFSVPAGGGYTGVV